MTKHIAIIAPNLHGNGAVRVTLNQAKALRDAGHRPELFILLAEGDFSVPDGIPVHYLAQSDDGDKKRLSPPSAQQLQQLVRQVENSQGAFDLFLSNTARCDKMAAACDFQPLYLISHCALRQELRDALKQGPLKLLKRIRQARVMHGRHVIGVSEGIAHELSHLSWLKPASVRAIYNAFPIDDIRALAAAPHPDLPAQPYMIHVGRLARQKRHDILFQALRRMPDAPPLVLLCNKPDKARALAQRYGVADRVIIPGFQTNPYPWIAGAELMLLSSDYEGLPTVLIEALICGTPVVSTDCPYGPAEILTGALARYLVPCRDPAALAQAAQACLNEQPDVRHAPILAQVTSQQVAAQLIELCNHA